MFFLQTLYFWDLWNIHMYLYLLIFLYMGRHMKCPKICLSTPFYPTLNKKKLQCNLIRKYCLLPLYGTSAATDSLNLRFQKEILGRFLDRSPDRKYRFLFKHIYIRMEYSKISNIRIFKITLSARSYVRHSRWASIALWGTCLYTGCSLNIVFFP